MALIKCEECGKEISDKASVCPNCACPIKKESVLIEKVNYSNGYADFEIGIYNDKITISRKATNNKLVKFAEIVDGRSLEELSKEFYLKDIKGIEFQRGSTLNNGHIFFRIDLANKDPHSGNVVYFKKKDNELFERLYNLIMEQYNNIK